MSDIDNTKLTKVIKTIVSLTLAMRHCGGMISSEELEKMSAMEFLSLMIENDIGFIYPIQDIKDCV